MCMDHKDIDLEFVKDTFNLNILSMMAMNRKGQGGRERSFASRAQ